MAPAVSVQHLGKRYRIGAAQGRFRYGLLRDVLADLITTPVRMTKALMGGAARGTSPISYIWALEDISFDVEEGRVLGIVGRNGAGKSTLLKILSRVTEPTKGLVTVRGRVGSLRSGSRFHPEAPAAGIFMNAVLGMKRAERAQIR
jgi:lipopolysaccharide transport system ATP-binding protein